MLSALLLLCITLFTLTGCSTKGQPIDALFVAADSQLYIAQQAGAEQLASAEFEEAKALYTQAEMALEKKDKSARILIQKANSKARLSEALAKRAIADAEAAKAEEELAETSARASRASAERIAAENELKQLSQ